jgi:sugar lactone lactonase YvrE
MRQLTTRPVVFACLAFASAAHAGPAQDEFRIKRAQVFEFASGPAVIRDGDAVSVSFATTAPCDATVSVEDSRGRIVRHLACGVLGENAPPPFKPGSLEQRIVWDGKNDRNEYVDNKDQLTIRVSLGLRAAFEKDLFREPKRRHGGQAPIFQAAQEGVYVYDGGNGIEFIKLYDHEGSYVRTVYPFPGDKIGNVAGITRRAYPQDGETLPVKPTFLQQTFLTCGNLYGYQYPAKYAIKAEQAGGDSHYGMYGNASSILAVNAGRLAIGKTYLFRMGTDGSSAGMDAEGPAIALPTPGKAYNTRGKTISVAPRSAALSPDGKTLYLTGYVFCHYSHASADIVGAGTWDAFHVVLKMDLAGDKGLEVFAGNIEVGKSGSDGASFHVPISVATDGQGRVYVADYMNNRVQVFSPDGKLLKSIAAVRPAIVSIAAGSGDIWVFSSFVYNYVGIKDEDKVSPALTVFGPFSDPRQKFSCPLPSGFGEVSTSFWYSGVGTPLSAAVDGHTDPPTVWMATEWVRENVLTRGRIKYTNIALFKVDKGEFRQVDSFDEDVRKSVKRISPAAYGRYRLYTNPANGRVYVGEGEAFDRKSFKTLVELNPENGRINIIDIPFDAEDMCFDQNGYAYLRNIATVVRYDSSTWREIPWDYGEEQKDVCTSSSSDRKTTDALGGLRLPADGGWHHGGMFVSSVGNLAVACGINVVPPREKYETGAFSGTGKPYTPAFYPGRSVEGRGGAPLIHIWDKHGKLIAQDAVPGIGGNTYGLGMDSRNGLYMMLNSTRIIDGKPYLNRLSGTLLKAEPGKVRILARETPVPLPESEMPKRPPDLVGSGLASAWVDGAEWMYGGVGYDGKNAGVGCGCWNARMAFDYFNRTFAPELDRFKVAVLDSNGNLIMRIGRYGNADSGGPGSAVPLGGDEVGMTHGAYLATDTDKRLFIADSANDRIFSVALGYHIEMKVPLKGIANMADSGAAGGLK